MSPRLPPLADPSLQAPPHRPETCLLIVDVQKGFIRDFMGDLPRRIEVAQQSYTYVAATRFINPGRSFYRSLIGWEKMGLDDPETALAFQPKPDAFLMDKVTYSCATVSFLDWLAQHDIGCVHVCGVRTDICVTQCAVSLFERGIEPVVLSDLCASTAGQAAHEAALSLLEKLIGTRQVKPFASEGAD